MVLQKLKYQTKLSITELDTFLSEFLTQFLLPVDDPATEESSLTEIYLPGKEKFLVEALTNYRKSMKRAKKMPQTASLVERDEQRIKLLSGTISYIRSCCKDVDEAVVAAAETYLPLLEQFKNYHKASNSSQSALIRKFVEAIQAEPYAAAFATLKLEARTEELEVVNEEYIALSDERDIAEKSIPDAPSTVRKLCVEEYRKLVNLINLAVQNNQSYLYEEKLAALAALTEKTQQLINRRRGKTEAEDSLSDEASGEEVA